MIPLFKVYMSPLATDKVKDVLSSGYIGEGPKVKEFENALKSFFRNDYVLTTNSATSAEHLVIHLLKQPASFRDGAEVYGVTSLSDWPGLNPGDEVLATPLTCTASNWPILANNLDIKWVDVDPTTLNMDLDDLARKITNKTKLIMLVLWGGCPVDFDRLNQIIYQARTIHGFSPLVILDCAHAIGSTYKKRHISNQGHISTFSFQAIKHLTTGDGGALVVPFNNLYDRAKLVRWYGIDREGARKDFRCEADIREWGFKFHMNDIAASIGLANIESLNKILDIHTSNAEYYNKNLSGLSGVTLLSVPSDATSSYWIYTMKVEKRDSFMAAMESRGIQVSRVHERNDKHTCVSKYRTILPSLDKVVNEMICIPVGYWINTETRQYIVESIKKGW